MEREVPVTEDNPEKSKKGLYKIKDNYLRFWFAFVYPNMSFIESGHSNIALNKIKQSLINKHTAFVYEGVCRERMWDVNGECTWPFHFTKLGSYWNSNIEIDIAALDPEGKNLILGECKYWKDPVGLSVLRDLEEKAQTVVWERDHRKTWHVLFSANGFTEDLLQAAESRRDLILCTE